RARREAPGLGVQVVERGVVLGHRCSSWVLGGDARLHTFSKLDASAPNAATHRRSGQVGTHRRTVDEPPISGGATVRAQAPRPAAPSRAGTTRHSATATAPATTP